MDELPGDARSVQPAVDASDASARNETSAHLRVVRTLAHLATAHARVHRDFSRHVLFWADCRLARLSLAAKFERASVREACVRLLPPFVLPARVLAVLLMVAGLFSTHPARADEPGSELSISLLTMGPGDHPFTKFGHDALLVHDSQNGRSSVYNYGTFAFDSPWLIVDFLQGRFAYWLSVSPLDRVLAQYAAVGRSVVAQELRLTPAERVRVAAFLAWNSRDANKYYKYDYYRDNCATRVRDVIDRATGGKLREAARAPARFTFRQHTLRLTADAPLLYLGLDLAMGDLIDQPITVWEEMFLPDRVEEAVRGVTVLDAGGTNEMPLVVSEVTLLADHRAPPRTAPPSWTALLFGVGVAIGSVFLGLGALAARGGRAARIALGASLGVLGLLAGTLGCLVGGLWAFTDHQVTYRNENVLQFAPWALVLVGLGVGVALGRPRFTALAGKLVTSAAAASALGLLMKALPTFDQRNGEIIALVLPIWVGAALALGRVRALR